MKFRKIMLGFRSRAAGLLPLSSKIVETDWARLLIYGFRFRAAERVLNACLRNIEDQTRAKPARRLRKAAKWNAANPLLGKETHKADLFEKIKQKISGFGRFFPVQCVGNWNAKWLDDKRLRVSGKVERHCLQVGLFVNDRLIKLVNTNPIVGDAEGRRRFRFVFKKDVMKSMPRKARLGIGSASGYLKFRGKKITYAGRGLKGNGTLFKKLESDFFITKKGRLKLAFSQDEKWKRKALAAYTEFRAYFEARFGYKPYLICGSLLGYYREGDFIPHDDDLDVSYLSRQQTPEAIKEETREIVFQMLRDGYDIKLARRTGFFKPKINGLLFDVTPMWYDQGTFWMLNATRIPGPRDIIEPVTTGRFRDVEVYVPNDPERYLELEYGQGWRVPDPGYKTVMDPDTSKYLMRSCLTRDELRDFHARLVSARADNPEMGRFSVAGMKVELL